MTPLCNFKAANLAFQRLVAGFVCDANERFAQEDGLSEDSIRAFESHLSKILKAGSRLERVIRRLPDPSCVPQEFRDRLRREQAQSQALVALLRTLKPGEASAAIPAEALR